MKKWKDQWVIHGCAAAVLVALCVLAGCGGCDEDAPELPSGIETDGLATGEATTAETSSEDWSGPLSGTETNVPEPGEVTTEGPGTNAPMPGESTTDGPGTEAPQPGETTTAGAVTDTTERPSATDAPSQTESEAPTETETVAEPVVPPADSVALATPYGSLYYDPVWDEILRIQQSMEGDQWVVSFHVVLGDTEYESFDVLIGGEASGGLKSIGQLVSADGTASPVYIRLPEEDRCPAEDDVYWAQYCAVKENEINRIMAGLSPLKG